MAGEKQKQEFNNSIRRKQLKTFNLQNIEHDHFKFKLIGGWLFDVAVTGLQPQAH